MIIGNTAGKDKNEQNEIYTPRQVMEKLFISKTTVYKLLRSGELACFKIGNHYRISKKSLENFIETMESSDNSFF